MTWLTLRQFRVSAAVAALALGVIAILLAVTGLHFHVSAAVTHCENTPGCTVFGSGGGSFLSHYHLQQLLSTVLVAVPGLIGAFWGAPLVARELETGTWRMVWTQGVTRTRWLAVKLAVVGAVAVAVTGLFTLMLTWRSSPLLNRFSAGNFGERGIAPMGYALFGLALGVAVGMLVRRTLPAMATTLVAFTAVRIVVTHWVRPHYVTPLKLSGSLAIVGNGLQSPSAGDWTISNDTVDAAGHVVNGVSCQVPGVQVSPGSGRAAIRAAHARANAAARSVPRACLTHYREVVTYQPANRYWAFQIYETAVFVGIALVLAGCCFWWIRHRLA